LSPAAAALAQKVEKARQVALVKEQKAATIALKKAEREAATALKTAQKAAAAALKVAAKEATDASKAAVVALKKAEKQAAAAAKAVKQAAELVEEEGDDEVESETDDEDSALEKRETVALIISKRGRRCEWEYECRWVGCPADKTTWEAVGDLTSQAALKAVNDYELAEKSRNSMSLMCAGIEHPIRTECCNTIVSSEAYDDSKKKCVDSAACKARLLQQCNEPASKRQRTQNLKFK
jgi:hypothetical protein